MKKTSVVKFDHGERTCAYELGKFCRFTYVKSFGTKPICDLFKVKLHEKYGWLQRCKECLELDK